MILSKQVLSIFQRFLHVWHGIDQTVIDNAVANGVDVFAHVCGKRRTLGATIITIFSHMTRDVSVFVKCDTIFFILPHSRTFKFYKVVQQHTEGMVGIVFFFEIHFSFQQ